MESTERAISSAERFLVPLKSMCSMKCEMPFSAEVSRREPVRIQTPRETDRTWLISSLITRTPLLQRCDFDVAESLNCVCHFVFLHFISDFDQAGLESSVILPRSTILETWRKLL